MTLLMTQETETLHLGLLLRHLHTYLGFTPYFRSERLRLSCLVIDLDLWLTSRPIVILRCRMTTVHQVTPTIIDRKSTRLNSSHSQISYAVFCLKKKRKRQ